MKWRSENAERDEWGAEGVNQHEASDHQEEEQDVVSFTGEREGDLKTETGNRRDENGKSELDSCWGVAVEFLDEGGGVVEVGEELWVDACEVEEGFVIEDAWDWGFEGDGVEVEERG